LTSHPLSPHPDPRDPHSTVLKNKLASQRLATPLSATIHLPRRKRSAEGGREETRRRKKEKLKNNKHVRTRNSQMITRHLMYRK
jgi:hypothetical protein